MSNWIFSSTRKYPIGPRLVFDINASDSTFSLITNGGGLFEVDWGDDSAEIVSANTGITTASHIYASVGTYTITISHLTGVFYPYYNNNSEAQKILSLNSSDPTWSFGPNLHRAWYGASSLSSISQDINFFSVSDFSRTWQNCTALTSFPPNAFDNCQDFGPGAFFLAFFNAGLSAQSIENILVSLDANGQAGVTLDMGSGTNATYSNWTEAAKTALTSLQGKGWIVSYNP